MGNIFLSCDFPLVTDQIGIKLSSEIEETRHKNLDFQYTPTSMSPLKSPSVETFEM